MEDNFSVSWPDPGAVAQMEEVICMGNEIETSELDGKSTATSQVVVEQDISPEDQSIVYLTEDQMLVVEQSDQDQYMTQVSEEIVTEQWDCPEEIVVGSETAVVTGDGQQTVEDVEIPLPTDQDEYTTSRPYPCDFCSRRFRKKANLMNHMVAHQTDRPHGCNLCGVRYIRKCDLMNHLKIHAYIPETDGLDEEDIQPLDESDTEQRRGTKRPKPYLKRKKYKIKEEYDSATYEQDDGMMAAGSSRSYNYVDEDMRLMEAMSHNAPNADYPEYADGQELRYPVSDPRKPFVCQHCGVGFAREKALASHSRVHGGDSPFECQKCGDMFWDLGKLREHVRSKHNSDLDLDEDDDDDDEDDDYSDEDTRYGTFYCSTCGLSFHRQDNLKRHQRVHVKEEYINDHEFGHICNVCGESFAEALDLLAHAEVHARTTEHRCMICGEIGNDPQAVAAHVQSKHGKSLPPNTCMLCGRTCKDRRTLLKHSWEHSKEKSFACSKCGKTFHNKARLKRHMLSHRNKIVACDVCGEEFPDGRTLMNHRHSHSSISGRQFPCRECGKTFGSRSSQQIHIRIHTGERPYGCRFCWKAFADGGTLRKHERIHTGEKPYACAVCPRAFNQRVVLREHIRSHHSGPDPKYSHSVTPYCCSVCSDMFATSQDLITHLIHHCDMNTAMKRQPQVGPRKYKRRRKLKPHELEMISGKMEDRGGAPMDEEEMAAMEQQQQQQQMQQQQQQTQQQQQRGGQYNISDSEEERERTRRVRKSVRNTRSPKSSLSECYTEIYNTCSSAIDNIDSLVKSSTRIVKKKIKAEPVPVPSRPKMIHTQKTRVAVETTEDGKVRHKTKTLVTRTQPAEIKSATGERIRPRTKNVSYHILTGDNKLQLATFGDEDMTQEAVSNLLKENEGLADGNNGLEQVEEQPIVQEQKSGAGPVPTNIIKITSSPAQLHNLRPGRTIIGPGSKVVRLVKGGMIITKNKKEVPEPENILPDFQQEERKKGEESTRNQVVITRVKQEPVDAGPLHELAELSMQHAQNQFKCEMCSAVFSDRAKLLDHVPIHI